MSWAEEKHEHPFSAGWLGRQTTATLKKVQASTSNFFLEYQSPLMQTYGGGDSRIG